MRVPRVFCDAGGEHGNQLGVVLEGGLVSGDDRQVMATHLGYAETVFVDDPSQGRIAIYTPSVELPFAGHPTVGTAWLLIKEGHPIDALRPPAGKVPVRREGEMTWVAGRPEWCPPWELRQFDSPGDVEALSPIHGGWIYAWAWIDEAEGLIRARCFVSEGGIEEDEATGSAALPLCAQLGREIEVRQGLGSIIWARPLDDGLVEIGGLVVEG